MLSLLVPVFKVNLEILLSNIELGHYIRIAIDFSEVG
jgi:hypothetical protein